MPISNLRRMVRCFAIGKEVVEGIFSVVSGGVGGNRSGRMERARRPPSVGGVDFGVLLAK